MATRSFALLALLALAVLGWAGPAAADKRDHALVDKIDVRPSPIYGLARVRALVSATELQGARIPQEGKPEITVKLGGAKVPFAWGLSSVADVELDVVIVVATTDVFSDSLERIRDALATGLLDPLEKLGTQRAQVAVIGYGQTTVGQKRLGSVALARAALAKLEADETTTEVALIKAVNDAVALAARTKPKVLGSVQRPIVIVVSDGDGIAPETRAKVTELGELAAKKGVRIHTLGYSPTKARRSLLTLGELSKRSEGTFRWIQEVEGWPLALAQLVDQLANQYVLTALAPVEEVSGKKLVVSIDNAGSPLTAEVKVPGPRCVKDTCDADQYCVRDQCVAHKRRSGGGSLRWILIALGGVLGIVVVGLGGRAIARRRGAGPAIAAPLPMAVAAAPGHAPAPAPAPVPGGPVLIVLGGPENGRQVPLHHGFTLGKAPGSHLSLAHDSTASTHHAQITFDGATWTLTDLGSTNGTFANGNRVTTVRLFPGMTVRLGSTDLRFWQQ
ncbi:MAG: FHA domain-containing protein [Myxococcales bacterium]|nr:FHA domain-containing protein [Myxococcales bacterium]